MNGARGTSDRGTKDRGTSRRGHGLLYEMWTEARNIAQSPRAQQEGPTTSSQGPDGPKRVGQLELNLVAAFPKPASWTATKERSQIVAHKWFPHTLDFRAIAGNRSTEISSAWDFLLKIVQTASIIRRLNFFSHANRDIIAMAGTVLADGSNVLLGTDGRSETFDPNRVWTLDAFTVKQGAIVNPYALVWSTFGENSAVNVPVGNRTFNLEQVRGRFATDAVIWLYLCHGAADPDLFQRIANTFQVTVKGFSEELVYCAFADFPISRKHKLAVKLPGMTELDSCQYGVVDFHRLDDHNRVRTASPRSPGTASQQTKRSVWTQARERQYRV